ncbi:MAG: hypothetical protein J0L50_12120 [Sphingomonadales bacterium]|nr:hypothetical protein [Sphingomonadales bacterium]
MRRIVLASLPLIALAAFAAPVAVRAVDADETAAASSIPSEEDPQLAASRAKQAIAGMPAREILSISGTQRIDDQVIHVDTLRFDDGATMQLLAGDRDAIFIVAKELRLSGPSFKANIEFRDRAARNGTNGGPPPPALAQLPRSGGNGAPGAKGARGAAGTPGLIRKLPTVYIVVGSIRQSTGGPADFSDLRINVDGIDGGMGGNGGRGQNGQPGQDGRHGASGRISCLRGPRSGGNGGAGGDFGPGGVGGNGGNGANIVFIVPQSTVDAIKDVRVRSRGGLPGEGGRHGDPGAGAGGGARGSAPGFCSSGGAHGGAPGGPGASPPSLRAPSGSLEGARGRVFYHVVDFFN